MHYVFLALAALASRSLASCAYGTHLSPRAEEGEVPIGNFGYNGATGPTNWLAIDPAANALCATGTRQSPVDMVAGGFPKVAGTAINLQLNDLPDGAEFENLGTTVEVVAENGGTMTIPRVGDFTLQQFHFHLPSEHLDNGTSQAMEMHMVWEGANASVAVLSAYIGLVDQNGAGAGQSVAAGIAGAAAKLRRGRPTKQDRRDLVRQRQAASVTADATAVGEVEAVAAATAAASTAATALLETVLNEVDKISTPGTATKTPALVLSELTALLTAGEFQSYTGSLTTPPCTEGVNWLVSTQKLSIEPSTFVKARNVIGFNARFPQNTLGQTNLLQLSAGTAAPANNAAATEAEAAASSAPAGESDTTTTTTTTSSTSDDSLQDAIAKLVGLVQGVAGSAAGRTSVNRVPLVLVDGK
ncbi:hypothetical protein SCUCBS95973_005500 [Sporothrix curviconia]|uniref:carbonic anhydrase n=1 Tax=Sporothrix curviconia TaxID=1260050 RepID=A0ABP0BZK0_9PEZI